MMRAKQPEKKRKFTAFDDQNISNVDSVTHLSGLKESPELGELTRVSAKIRRTIVVSHDTDQASLTFDPVKERELNEERKQWFPRVLPKSNQIRELFFEPKPMPKKEDYATDNGSYIPVPGNEETQFDLMADYYNDMKKAEEENELRFFFMDADYSIDPHTQNLSINVFGLTDTRWAKMASEEQKRKKSFNVPCMMRIQGFEPHFFIEHRKEWDDDVLNELIQVLDTQLIERYQFTKKELEDFESAWGCYNWVTGWEKIQYQDFMGYQGTDMKTTVKIKVRHPRMVKACRDLFENPLGKLSKRFKKEDDDHGFRELYNMNPSFTTNENGETKVNTDEGLRELFSQYVDLRYLPPGWMPPPELIGRLDDTDIDSLARNGKYSFIPPTAHIQKMIGIADVNKVKLYEADVDFIQRYLADNDIIPCSWYYVNKRRVEGIDSWENKVSKCLVEGIIEDYHDLHRVSDKEIQNDLPNFVRFSFDDEMETPEGRFPDPELDAIIKKGVTINVDKNRDDYHSFVFSLGEIAYTKQHDFACLEYDNEPDMLKAWIDFFKKTDPDIILHYNGNNFDWNYDLKRCKHLDISDIQYMTRHKTKTIYRPAPRTNRGKTKHTCRILGRTNIDMLRVIEDNKKFDDNSLGAVCQKILGKTKEEFDVHLLSQLQKTKQGNEKSSVYVEKDARLPLELYDKLNTGGVQTAQIARILLQNCFDRAQGAKVEGKLRQECISDQGIRLLKETLPKIYDNDPRRVKTTKASGKKSSHYKGATVIKPQPGYYKGYVFVLDFASMYPSIMQAFNICYTTLVTDAVIKRLGLVEGEDYWRVPDWDTPDDAAPIPKYNPDNPCFVTKKIKEGILPRIEKELGEYRGQVKSELKDELKVNPNGSLLATNLDGLQNAIKAWMNSVYGLSGDPTSIYYLKHIAATITRVGRWMLHSIKVETQHYYNRKNYRPDNPSIPKVPYPFDANVVYGDSVTKDTPILVRDNEGCVDILSIDELSQNWESYEEFKPEFLEPSSISNRREKQKSKTEYEVWTDEGWSEIKKVIRHKVDKKLYRVNTHTGVVDVTEDHSLLNRNKEIIKPKDLEIGNHLLHSFPNDFDHPGVKVFKDSRRVSTDDRELVCTKCKQTKNIEEFHRGGISKKRYNRHYSCKKCRSTNKYISPIEYTQPYNITPDEAWVWGLFMADGTCGTYNTKDGIKYSWNINKQDINLLEEAKTKLKSTEPYDFKILDVMNSSSVYRLIPHGSIKSHLIEKYNVMYDKNGYKKVPKEILNAPHDVRKSFYEGYYSGDGCKTIYHQSFSNRGKIGTQGLWYLMKSIGYDNLSLTTREDKPDIYRIQSPLTEQRKEKTIVKKIIELGNTDDFVYDLETKCGRFHAGIGEIVVKNTDSIMVHLENFEEGYEWMGTDPEFIDKMGEVIAKRMDRVIFHNRKPIHLEYEKKYLPGYNLIQAKTYEGYLLGPGKKVGDDGTWLDKKGVSDKKRGFCSFFKECGDVVSKKLSIESDLEGAWDYAVERLALLKRGKIPFGQLIKTQQFSKQLKDYGTSTKWDEENEVYVTRKVPLSAGVKLARRLAYEAGKKDFDIKQANSNRQLKEPDDYTKWSLFEAGSIIKFVYAQKDFEHKQKSYGLSSTENPNLGVSDLGEDPFVVSRRDQPLALKEYFDETAKMLWKKFAGPFKEVYPGKDSKEIRMRSTFWQRLNRDPRIATIPFTTKIQKNSAIRRFCVEKKSCESCGVTIHPGKVLYLCDQCEQFQEYHRAKVYDEMEQWDDTLTEIESSCMICVGGDPDAVRDCANISCGNYNTRLSAKSGMVRLLDTCDKLGF